jgi:hypothetical protein
MSPKLAGFATMSALTINKIACRVNGTLFALLGVRSLFFGGLLTYISLFGLPDRLADYTPFSRMLASVIGGSVTLFRAWASTPEGNVWGVGVIFLVAAAIPIAIGVYSWLRYLWAMIIGTLLWLVFYFPGPLFFPGKTWRFGAFEIIGTLVIVLLTIVAIMFRPRGDPGVLDRGDSSGAKLCNQLDARRDDRLGRGS